MNIKMKGRNRQNLRGLFLAAVFTAGFCLSCAGVNADITLNPDNSGVLALEYRISKLIESLGKQDGNERWLPIPSGEADFERTLARLGGMKLLSFSSEDDGKDIVVAVKLEFTDMDALLRFLDASGEGAVFVRENASQKLTLTLSKGGGGGSKDLEDLFARVSEGYRVNIGFTFPREGVLTAPDIEGGEIQPRGKKVFCSYPIGRLLSAREAVNLEFRW
jgi:hypothetical protein